MANFNFNKVILGGRLASVPELKATASGVLVTSFSIAVNRRFTGKNEGQQPVADFINCTAWRKTAEFISKYFDRGDAICVEGSIRTRSWTDQSGAKRYSTDVVVDEAYFVDSKRNAARTDDDAAPYMPEAYMSGDLGTIEDDEDLPF